MEKKSIITGKTIDEAKANASAQLGLDADSFSYQVVQMPKSGFLGIGAQPAKIEVTYQVPDPAPEAPKVALSAASRSKPKLPKKPEPKPEQPQPAPAPQPKAEPEAKSEPAEPQSKPERRERPPREPREPREKKPQAPKAPKEPKVYAPAEPGSVEEKIETFIAGLLERMDSKAVPHCWKEDGNTYQVELVGEDLGYLIGRRGDTLDPMNAYERHVIHAALQDMDNITTHSTGVEPNRCVVIEYVR